MEDIKKNIEAIEEEKKEYLDGLEQNSDQHSEKALEDIAPEGVPSDMQDGTGEGKDEVETEVDVLEFSLDDEEINELMENLRELKETKTSFNFEVDDENELLINYEEVEEDDTEY